MYAANLAMDQIMSRPAPHTPAPQSGNGADSHASSKFSVLLQQKYQKMKDPAAPQANGEDPGVPDEQASLAASLAAFSPVAFWAPQQSEPQPLLAQAVQTLPNGQLSAVNLSSQEAPGLDGASLSAALTPEASPAETAPEAALPESKPAWSSAAQNAPLSSLPHQAQGVAAQTQSLRQGGGEPLNSGAQKQSEESLPEAANLQIPLFPQAEAVPVQVGQVHSQPVELPFPDAADQLSGRLAQALSQHESKLEVYLAPQHLGDLSVELTRADDGSLSVLLKPATKEAAALLEHHSARLQTLLAGSAQVQVRVEVQHSVQQSDLQQFLNPDESGQHSRQQHQQQQQRHRQHAPQDFLQQLRLGLTQLQPAAV